MFFHIPIDGVGGWGALETNKPLSANSYSGEKNKHNFKIDIRLLLAGIVLQKAHGRLVGRACDVLIIMCRETFITPHLIPGV